MRTKTTLFLLVLLAALGAVAYYVIPPIDAEQDRKVILAPQEAAQLDYLKFEFRDRPQPVILEKQGAGWRIVEPVLWPANIFAIERLLNQLQFLKKVSSFPAERLPDYGLDPPEGVLTYGYGATRRTLRVGKVTDLERNVYLLPEGRDQIVVVQREVLEDLRRPLEELRSDEVFSAQIAEVRSWIIQVGALRVHLVAEGEKWKLDSPIRARADKAAVDTLLKRVLDLKVEEFWRDGQPDLNVLGLASPSFRITIVSSGGRDELLLGRPVDPATRPDVYYAKREDNATVFTVRVDDVPASGTNSVVARDPTDTLIDKLRNAQAELRDRRVVEIDPERVQSILLSPAGQPPTTLQRLETGAWQVIARTADRGLLTMDGDPDVIGALLQEIAELRAVRDGGFVIGGDAPSATDLDVKFGLTGAAWQIQISERAPGAGSEIRPPQTIKLGRRAAAPGQSGGPENLQYATADEGFVYLVDRALDDDLHPEPYHYRNRLLRQLAAGESITALTLKRLANDEVVFNAALAGPDQTWADALILHPAAQREAALALLNVLRELRARAIIAPEFSKSVPGGTEVQPWTWLLEATVALEGGATQQSTQLRLYLDAYEGGTELLVGVPELNLVVAAAPALVDALRPLLLERTDPGVPPPAETPAPGAAPASPPVDAPAPVPAAPVG